MTREVPQELDRRKSFGGVGYLGAVFARGFREGGNRSIDDVEIDRQQWRSVGFGKRGRRNPTKKKIAASVSRLTRC